jgi:PIN domain nuclease of toxin-antitoxin system
MPILLDTHAWVWWVSEDRRLSKGATAAIRRATRDGDSVWVSIISIWEVATKVEKKQLVLDRPIRQWMDQATTVTGLFLADLSAAILLDSCELPQPFHGDPADQMIVASARHLNAALLTKDRKLRSYRHVQTVW